MKRSDSPRQVQWYLSIHDQHAARSQAFAAWIDVISMAMAA
jgi:hypothetical protein